MRGSVKMNELMNKLFGFLLFILPIETFVFVKQLYTKTFKLSLASILFSAGLMRYLVTSKGLRIPVSYALFFGGMLTASCVSTVLSPSPSNSLMGMAQVVVIFMFYYGLSSVQMTVEEIRKLIFKLLLFSLLIVAFGALQSVYGFQKFGSAEQRELISSEQVGQVGPSVTRASSAFMNANSYAVYCAFLILNSFVLVLEKKGPKKIGYALLLLAFCAALISTFNKSVLLGLGAASVGIYYFRPAALSRRKKFFIIFGALVSLMLVGLIVLTQINNGTILKAFRIGDNISDVGNRVNIWKKGIQTFISNPIVGIGYYNFVADSTAWRDEGVRHPHNGFLKYSVELGLPGSFLYLMLICLTIRSPLHVLKLNKSKSSIQFATVALGTNIVFFVVELFDAGLTMGGSSLCLLFWMLNALQASVEKTVVRSAE